MLNPLRSRIAWTVCGFALGYGFAIAEATWKLWPMQDGTSLVFLRWLGKASIKFALVAIVIVVTVQLLNVLITFIQDYRSHSDDKKHVLR
jgi:hypothetical protein